MSAPTAPPERKCRRCGARDNLKVIIDVLGATYKTWECRGGCPTPPLEPGALERLEKLLARATDGPWRVVLDDTESATTVWRVCTSPEHPADEPDFVHDCCADGGLHGEPFYTEADAELVAALRNAAPELIQAARKRDYYADLNAIQATRLEEAWARLGQLRPVVDAVRAWRARPGDGALLVALADAVDALDADAPLDPADREDLARTLIADLRAPVADTTPAQIVPHGPTRPPYGSPERTGTCDATDAETGMNVWRCTLPSGHTGGRHHSETPGLGSYTWGWVPTPDEAEGGDPR